MSYSAVSARFPVLVGTWLYTCTYGGSAEVVRSPVPDTDRF